MKLAVFLGLASLGQAAIAFVASSSGGCTANSTTCASSAVSIASGNTIIVIYAISNGSSQTATAPTVAGNTFTQINGCANNNSTTVRVECWSTAVNGSATITSAAINCNVSSSTRFVCAFAAYSGVSALGRVTVGTASAANPVSPTFNTDDANDWCVAAFAGQGTGTFTTLTGNLRNSSVSSGTSSTARGGAIADNTVASAGSACTASETNADTVWALAAVELRTASTPVKTAAPTQSLVLRDIMTGLGAHFSTPAEAVPSLDSTSGSGAHFGAPREVLSFLDLPGRGSSASVKDYAAAADLGSGLGSHFASRAESLTAGASQSGLAAHFSSTNEALMASTLQAGSAAHFGVPKENLLVNDLGSGQGSHFAARAENLTVSASQSGLAAHFSSTNEALIASTSQAGSAGRFVASSESLFVTDLKLGQAAHFVGSIDLSASLDRISQNAAHFAQPLEPLPAADGAGGLGSHLAQTSDVFLAGESRLSIGQHFASAKDYFLALDGTVGAGTHLTNTTEALASLDLSGRQASHFGSGTDASAIFDLSVGAKIGAVGHSVTVSELLNAVDSQSVLSAFRAAPVDLTRALDAVARVGSHFAVATEASVIGQSINRGLWALTADSVLMLTSTNQLAAHVASSVEALRLTDPMGIFSAHVAGTNDLVALTERGVGAPGGHLFTAFVSEMLPSWNTSLGAGSGWDPVVDPLHAAQHPGIQRLVLYPVLQRTAPYPTLPRSGSYPKSTTGGQYSKPRKAVVTQ